MKNEMLALILAGGQGTRLGKLTQSIAKPAVQFGGRYRIIDFALSNCANSGIHHVGVITQYQPLALILITILGMGHLGVLMALMLVLPFYNLTQQQKVIVGSKEPVMPSIKTLITLIVLILTMSLSYLGIIFTKWSMMTCFKNTKTTWPAYQSLSLMCL